MEDNKVVLLGAGNVATHLGRALIENGYQVVQVYSRTEAAASVLAKNLSATFTTSLDELYDDAHWYIVALKDSVLPELIPSIVKGKEDALFLHTAGSIPMNVWKGYAKNYGVLYPMQTFSKYRQMDFMQVPFFIEANNQEGMTCLKTLAHKLSPKVYEASSEQRKYLHLAAVFACNFTNHMYALCDQLLDEQGLPFEVMLPLIDETARKVHELSPKEAQTGPAIRYDENVIKRHLGMLAERPNMQEIYEKISENIHRYDKL